MIVSHIFGGLGNQLFQFAFGRALAARLGVEFRFDYRSHRIPELSHFCLHHFSIDAQQAERRGLPAIRHDGLLPYLRDRLRGSRFTLYEEKGIGFDPETLSLGDNTYLKGYWQSERYFRDQADLVRRHLQVVTPPGPETRRVMSEQDACLPVSLHVRRGDYVSNAKFNATYGTCSPEYYRAAALHLAEKSAREPVFFAFSDEPGWVRENLDLPFEIRVVGHNAPEAAYDDIRLMSRCRHHIVANSSFSWWGAWLNPDPGKIVVAPKRWFADARMQDHDLIPPEWVTL